MRDRRQADPLEYCPDAKGGSFIPDDLLCRVQYKLSKLFTFTHPAHYAVVQVQQVIPRRPRRARRRPCPRPTESKPVVSVVLVRDLGDVRLIPVLYFVISLSLFILFAWIAAQPGQDAEEEQGAGGGRGRTGT